MIPLAWLAPLAAAADLEVGGGGYATIQDALDVAASGDRLQVHGGSWVGAHEIADPTPADGLPFEITIEAWPGEQVTLVSTSAISGAVHANGATVTVRDLLIDGDGNRAARVSGTGSLTLVQVEVFDAVRGGASGGAVIVEAGSSLRVEDAWVHENRSTFGGGAFQVASGASATILRTRFEGNTSDGPGGALRCEGVCIVTDSRFVGNVAGGAGGAVFVEDATGFDLDGTWFCDNVAVQQAGALAVFGTTGAGELGHNVFFASVAGQQGGAVYSDSTLLLYNSDFVANRATQQGSAVYATGSVEVINAIVVDHDQSQQIFYGSGLDAREVTLFENALPVAEGNASIADDQTVDPDYVSYVPGDCEGSDLHLQAGSPALGVGDPTYGEHHGALGEVCVPEPEVAGDNIDQDCDGVDLCYLDADGDRVGSATLVVGTGPVCNGLLEARIEGDCDDGDPERFPGNVEDPLDGVDGDCDGSELCYADADGDGYGSGLPEASSTDWTCSGAGVSSVDTDCGPADATVSPGAPERCENGIDDDCDGEVDTDAVPVRWYHDGDLDEYGDPNDSVEQCAPPQFHVAQGGDCDDGDPEVNPGEPEQCDGLDQNCDGQADEGLPTVRSWEDADGDGFGDPEAPRDGCRPGGFVLDDGDCDDADDDVNPDALELCNGIDDDCDGRLATCEVDGRGGESEIEGGSDAVAGCGCSGVGPGGWGWAWGIAGAGLARRRTKSSRGR
jgi:hypothetical protein